MTQGNDEKQIIELEEKFWNSIRDRDTSVALKLLTEPALMVSSKGAMKFDHAGYRKMAENDAFKLLDFELSKVQVIFPDEEVAIIAYQADENTEMSGKKMSSTKSYSSTWLRKDSSWKCAVHTEALMDK